jgi:ketosteroid isomerase-like protein
VKQPSDNDIALLKRTYAAFNARDLEGTLSTMKIDVVWPNGMEGGVVHGHDGVRAYWTRQWGMVDPHVEPKTFELDDSGRVAVGVHQVVHDLAGRLLLDRMVVHAYHIVDGLIQSMDICE